MKGGEYDANGKKEWQAPALEVLEVNQTMAGTGYRQIDWVTVHDADLYDPTS
ncbi:paeninodin family lasso peptide [Paenibacillus amylolyticus]|nr:paeninodin family lasso peptide [Paenibacillus sp. OVF10]WKL00787.1 paeninodin family lasso peptide [Paenibacillus amylolyticus]